jgi:hypothetical protein
MAKEILASFEMAQSKHLNDRAHLLLALRTRPAMGEPAPPGRQFNNLGGNKPSSGIVAQCQTQFSANRFQRKRHLPDHFRLECLPRKEWRYWHGA